MDLSLIRSDWTSLRFDSLQHLTNNFLIEENDHLRNIFIQKVKNINGSIRVRGNRHLLPEWINNLKSSDLLDIQPPGECLTNGKTIPSTSSLKDCRAISGNLSFVGLAEGSGNEPRIEMVAGCLEIVKTRIKDLKFLFATQLSNCSRKHRIEGNEFLCNEERVLWSLRQANPGQEIIWENNCEPKERWTEEDIVPRWFTIPFVVFVTNCCYGSVIVYLIWMSLPQKKQTIKHTRIGPGPYAGLTLDELGLPDEKTFCDELEDEAKEYRKKNDEKLPKGDNPKKE